jgi:ABC-type dipeptide/oligopeptide/nickel transport system ATPase component
MVGRELGDIYGWQPREYGKERLRLEQVKAPGVRQPVSLSVRSGEIVGLFGLVGAGRSELMKGLFGGSRITGGQVYIDGRPLIFATGPGDSGRDDALPGRPQSGGDYSGPLGARQHQYQRSPQAYSPAALSTTPGKRRTPTSISNR